MNPIKVFAIAIKFQRGESYFSAIYLLELPVDKGGKNMLTSVGLLSNLYPQNGVSQYLSFLDTTPLTLGKILKIP